MLDISSFVNAVPIVFILTATILSNFLGDTMVCKIQKIFSYNYYLKYIIVLFLIYTTISLVNKKTSPLERFKKSLVILIVFILFTKNTLRMTIIISVFMILLFIIEDYINYYKNTNKHTQFQKLEKISKFLKYLILFLIIIGHIIYLIKQKQQYGNDFNLIELYKGSKCVLE